MPTNASVRNSQGFIAAGGFRSVCRLAEARTQLGDFLPQGFHGGLERVDAGRQPGTGVVRFGTAGGQRLQFRRVGFAAQQVHVAHFFLPRHAGQGHDQRWLVLGQPLQRVVDVVQIRELEQSLGVGFEFPGGLRSAQHHRAQQGQPLALQPEHLAGQVLVAGRARAPGLARVAEGQQLAHGSPHLALGISGHRMARGFLVTGGAQGIDGQRILLRRGFLLLDQATEHANLDGGKNGHGKSLRIMVNKNQCSMV
jgi:hypothetical protein